MAAACALNWKLEQLKWVWMEGSLSTGGLAGQRKVWWEPQRQTRSVSATFSNKLDSSKLRKEWMVGRWERVRTILERDGHAGAGNGLHTLLGRGLWGRHSSFSRICVSTMGGWKEWIQALWREEWGNDRAVSIFFSSFSSSGFWFIQSIDHTRPFGFSDRFKRARLSHVGERSRCCSAIGKHLRKFQHPKRNMRHAQGQQYRIIFPRQKPSHQILCHPLPSLESGRVPLTKPTKNTRKAQDQSSPYYYITVY